MLLQLLRRFILLLFLLIPLQSICSGYTISITEKDNRPVQVKLFGFYGAESFFIDSINLKTDKKLTIDPDHFYQGFYRVTFNDSLNYDFIAAWNDSLAIQFDLHSFRSSLTIDFSEDNKLLLKLKKELHEISRQIVQLEQLNESDSMVNAVITNSIDQLRDAKNHIIDRYNKQFRHEVFRKLSDLNRDLLPENTTPEVYFTYFNLSDSVTIRTNLFPQKIIDYFAFYTTLDEASFKNSVDLILQKASLNKVNYNYTLYFLLRLFGEVGPEVIFQYILSEHYLDNSCDLEIKEDELKNQVRKFVSLMPGNMIPILEGRNEKGETITLYDEISRNEKTILFFWNPDCFHCKEIIPRLKKNDIPVFGFVITNNMEKWQESTADLPWINISDLQGWDSPVVKQFMITKTPFFIVVGNDGIIKEFDAKPEKILTETP